MLAQREVKQARPRAKVPPCTCPAYAFPHRRGSGACPIGTTTVCAACGKSTRGHLTRPEYETVDGRSYKLSDGGDVSHCCEAPLIHEWQVWEEFEWVRG